MIDQTLKRFLRLLVNLGIFTVTACFMLFAFIQHSGAAVAPNGQYGKCGPYYLWYQVGPDSLRYSGDYVDLCEITFDISDVLDDFDLVYFTDTPYLRRASLDKNRDGISDQYFQFPSGNQNEENHNPSQITWKPEIGCARINLRECWGSTFNERCGYAMISIQPKPGVRNGSARIPVRVTKRCPPHGVDCSETAVIVHRYSDCFSFPTLDFIVHKQVNPIFFTATYNQPQFKYTLTLHNSGERKGDTVLTDIVSSGTNSGKLVLSELKIDKCLSLARCSVLNATDREIRISVTGLPAGETVTVSYTLTGNADEISKDDVSYFTNTVTLSNGSSSQVTVGIRGRGKFPSPRPERPRR